MIEKHRILGHLVPRPVLLTKLPPPGNSSDYTDTFSDRSDPLHLMQHLQSGVFGHPHSSSSSHSSHSASPYPAYSTGSRHTTTSSASNVGGAPSLPTPLSSRRGTHEREASSQSSLSGSSSEVTNSGDMASVGLLEGTTASSSASSHSK